MIIWGEHTIVTVNIVAAGQVKVEKFEFYIVFLTQQGTSRSRLTWELDTIGHTDPFARRLSHNIDGFRKTIWNIFFPLSVAFTCCLQLMCSSSFLQNWYDTLRIEPLKIWECSNVQTIRTDSLLHNISPKKRAAAGAFSKKIEFSSKEKSIESGNIYHVMLARLPFLWSSLTRASA